MNNSKIAIENAVLQEEPELDRTPYLRGKEQELVAIIEALEALSRSNYWLIVKSKLFDGDLEALQAEMQVETDPAKLFRLQGRWQAIKRYSNLEKLAQAKRNELDNIKNQLKNG